MHYRYSIIIPHYNDVDRLTRLLGSIPQHRTDIQVLVIDDYSPNQDKLHHLKQKYPNILWLSTEQNLGAGRARNIGLENAKGDFLLFADSDDEFTKDAFDIMDSEVTDNDELCYFLAESIQEHDQSPSNRADRFNWLCQNYLDTKSEKSSNLLKSEHVIPCAKIYNRLSIIKINTRFDETLVSNDVAFNVLSSYRINNFRVIPKVTYRIYRRAGSLTAKETAETFLERLKVAANLSLKLKQEGYKHTNSASDFLIRSLQFGPKTALKTLQIVLKSDLKIEPFKAINPLRWYRYLKFSKQTADEFKKLRP